ncbi:MAG: hypothetical protein B7Y12_20895 [Rhizobiales bacterium 24-66-13]|jgi:hypothetical protein|nr:MAG: hypothetical protein B7Y12_20895 [Rhizobiales bacterium 24-66-13]OZB07094.1 MAG: hypothetical protein B7X67_09355 [Rhizobiales bacterium 39-66-18]
MRTVSKSLLSLTLLASLTVAATPSAFAATKHKPAQTHERLLPAAAQPVALASAPTAFPFNWTAPTHEDPAKDPHWGPAHNASPALW